MSWDFVKITYPIAAKPHRCAECGGDIPVGAKHSYTAGKVEGDFADYRMCMECADLAMAWCELINEEGWGLGSLREDLAGEGVHPPYADFIARAQASRSRMQRRFRLGQIARKAADDVIEERRRHIVEEFSADHDDKHVDGEIALAAAAYALGDFAPDAHFEIGRALGEHLRQVHGWEINLIGKDRRRQLVIAGALILAEIERLDRA